MHYPSTCGGCSDLHGGCAREMSDADAARQIASAHFTSIFLDSFALNKQLPACRLPASILITWRRWRRI